MNKTHLFLISLLLIFCIIVPISAYFNEEIIATDVASNRAFCAKQALDGNISLIIRTSGTILQYLKFNREENEWSAPYTVYSAADTLQADCALDDNGAFHVAFVNSNSPYKPMYCNNIAGELNWNCGIVNDTRSQYGVSLEVVGSTAYIAWVSVTNEIMYSYGSIDSWTTEIAKVATSGSYPKVILRMNKGYPEIAAFKWSGYVLELHSKSTGSWVAETALATTGGTTTNIFFDYSGSLTYIGYFNAVGAANVPNVRYKSGASWYSDTGLAPPVSYPTNDGAVYYNGEFHLPLWLTTDSVKLTHGVIGSWSSETLTDIGTNAYDVTNYVYPFIYNDFGFSLFYQNESDSLDVYWLHEFDYSEPTFNETPYVTLTAESGIEFNTNEYVSFNFVTNIPDYNWVVWGFTNGDEYYLDKILLSYMKTGNQWYQYNEDTFDYDIAVDAPLPYRITQSWDKSTESYQNQYGSGYEHEVYVKVSNTEIPTSASDSLEVTVLDSPDMVSIPIYVYSASTGGLLNNWNARIWEFQPSNTTTYIYNKNSPYTYSFKYMGYYQIEINKTSYSNETYNYIITPDLNKIQIYLGKACGAPSGQGCINFYVMRSDDWNVKISGVSITLNNQTKQTNSAGFVQFFVPIDIEYDYNAIKEPDYYASSGTIEIDDEYEVLQELVYLIPKSIMPTTAPLPTITPTIAPTLTPEEREGMGIVQFIIYYLSRAFGTNTSETGLILGAGIIFIFLIVGGMVAGGMGAIGGMAAGFVISLALKVLPIWTFFAVIGLAFLGLVFFRNKDG